MHRVNRFIRELVKLLIHSKKTNCLSLCEHVSAFQAKLISGHLSQSSIDSMTRKVYG
jgi:hypothetical protein